MTILTTTTPGLNEDRRARWSAIRAAFPNTTSAERLVPTAVGPVTKINLATARPGRARFALQFIGNVVGGAAFLWAAMFYLPALINAAMGAI